MTLSRPLSALSAFYPTFTEFQERSGAVGLQTASDHRPALIHKLGLLRKESSVDNWDGEGSLALSLQAYQLGVRFALALENLKSPQVSVDPDGWYLFEWYEGPSRQLLLALNPSFRMHYSGNIDGQEIKGDAIFFDTLPQAVEEVIQKFH